MQTDNSFARVTQHLRGLARAEPAGARLPSVRALMRELQVGPATVQQAMGRLATEGLLEARPGRGTFVAQPAARPPPAADLGWQSLALGPSRAASAALAALCVVVSDETLALNVGYLPPELQATSLLAEAASRAQRRPGVWARMPAEGIAPLRTWFSEQTAGVFQPHEVTICPGTQAGISAAFRALASPGDPLLVESPTYVGGIAAARAAGLVLVPVATDADGVRPDLLEEAFRRTGARLFYGQPLHANPSGAVLSADRRARVLAAVAASGAFMIEDDWARDFHLDLVAAPPPLAAADRDGHVVYVRSLTKTAAPGLRIGAICARGAALGRLRDARLVDDFFVPGPMQETALALVTNPGWPRHLRKLRDALRERRDAAAAAVRRHLGQEALPLTPQGGLHLWVRLPDGASDLDVAAAAARAGVLVSAGRDWFPAEPPGPFLRLSFAAARPERIEDAARLLAAAV